MRRVAVIPARGGSKRLPRKNVLPFWGRPMLAWTVDAALDTGLFQRVVVSTEDAEIAETARIAGAEVAARDPELAGDGARVTEVCLDFLCREEEAGCSYDVLCVLYATTPLRTAEDIRGVVDLVEPGQWDFALAVTHYDLPPHQALRRGPAGGLEPMWPEMVTARAEEVGELLVDNGSTYAASVTAFRENGEFYGPGLRGHVMPRSRSVDLDDAEDWELLEFYAARRGLGKGPGS